jgi:hypothetical protein
METGALSSLIRVALVNVTLALTPKSSPLIALATAFLTIADQDPSMTPTPAVATVPEAAPSLTR